MSYPSEKECETIETLARIAAPMRGGQTGYTAYDVVRAMQVLAQGAGRPLLSRILGLGEASVKTMLKRMRDEGLIARSGRANVLTDRGMRVLGMVGSRIKVAGPLDGFQWMRSSYVIVVAGVNPPVNMIDTIKERDYLVARGCREAIVGGMLGGKVVVPGAPDEVASDLEKELATLQTTGDALVYVVPSECLKPGYQAAVDAILDRCKPGG